MEYECFADVMQDIALNEWRSAGEPHTLVGGAPVLLKTARRLLAPRPCMAAYSCDTEQHHHERTAQDEDHNSSE